MKKLSVKLFVEEDEELRNYIKELVVGQVKSIIRQEIARVVKEELQIHILTTLKKESLGGIMETIGITIEQLDNMKHAIGYRRDRGQRGKYSAYRNYYADRENDSWEALVGLGYADRHIVDGKSLISYSVSKAGFALLEMLLDIKITETD